eukprot:Gb_31142 [translate_table: standard]
METSGSGIVGQGLAKGLSRVTRIPFEIWLSQWMDGLSFQDQMIRLLKHLKLGHSDFPLYSVY